MKRTTISILLLSLWCLCTWAEEIHEKALAGDTAALEAILSKTPQKVDRRDPLGRTPLHLAVFKGHGQSVELLIGRGANVNAMDTFGFSPLDFAVIKNRNELVQRLIVQGARAGYRENDEGGAPRVLPLLQLDADMADALLTRGGELKINMVRDGSGLYNAMLELKEKVAPQGIPTGTRERANRHRGAHPVHEAAAAGQAALVKSILKTDPSLANARDERDITPLHYAAVNGHLDVVEYLVSKGAAVDARNNIGITPLYGASSAGKTAVARVLIGYGADVNAAADEGAVPLHAAVSREMARLLVRHGARVRISNISGFTPLHTAATFGHRDVAEYLLERGADVESRTRYGWTPLMEAVYGNKKGVVELLISRGADVNAKNESGSTPLKIARTLERLDIVDLLTQHGAVE